MLSLDRVDVFYGQVQAVREVSLALAPGKIVALFGANGAGKSTTLKAVSGLTAIRNGSVTIDGERIDGLAPERIAARGVALIPEGRGIFPKMSVRQNLTMGGYVQRVKPRALGQRIDEAIAMFPILGDRMEQAAGTMSGGEQQMLAIARALIAQPRFLLLDEPSHGLAPLIVREVFATLSKLRERGVGMLIVEQFATVALAYADDAVVLDRGRVSFAGPAATLKADRSALTGAYLGGAGR